MSDDAVKKPYVAVIGAGPAGLYGTQQLVKQGAHVVLFNRDIKPGGLAEYGIYPDKYKMKDGLRSQFDKILASPEVEYLGNVVIGEHGALTLDDLKQAGFDAILVTVGAQGTKSLGLPGEALRGVYHAKEVVYHYNRLPPFSTQDFPVGKHVVVVGVGNVMMDLAHWTVRELNVETFTAVARRGPAEIKFDKKEFAGVGANVDIAALDVEIARCAPYMRAVDENPDAARADILAGLAHALPPVTASRILFSFLVSPKALLGDAAGNLRAVVVEENELVAADDGIKARGLGRTHEIACDTIIFAIGDQVDAHFGLPVARGEFVKNPSPRFPVEAHSYEAYDLQTQQPLEGIFVAGWARQASTGLVGVARKDGTNAANAMAEYFKTRTLRGEIDRAGLQVRLQSRGAMLIGQAELARLSAAEKLEAQKRGLPEFKFATNAEMLDAIGLG